MSTDEGTQQHIKCTCKKCNCHTVHACIHIEPACKCCTYEEDGVIYHREDLMENPE